MHHRPRPPGNGRCSLAWCAPTEAAQRAVHIGVGHVHHILRRSGYAEIYRQQAPQWASMAFLQGNIAWATQARAQDEDPNSLREALRNALIRPTGHTPKQEIMQYLTSALSSQLTAYPVSPWVNSPKNNDERCIKPAGA